MPVKTFVRYFVALLFVNLIFIAPAFAQGKMIPFNERFVIGALETFMAAELTYFHTPGNEGNFGDFPQLRNAGLIDPALAYGEKYGYQFSLTIIPPGPVTAAQYRLSAIPRYYGKGGKRSFYLDRSGVIRGANRNGAPATSTDPIIRPNPCGEDRIIPFMRAFNAAEATYFATVGANVIFGNINNLSEMSFIDGYIGGGVRCGYRFTTNITVGNIIIGAPSTYRVWAVPEIYPTNGIRSYFTDQTGIVRGADKGGALAGRHDPPV